jgi:fatty-acyl-CoA synthase
MTTFTGPPLDGFEGIGSLTMGAFIDEVADRFGGAEALVFDDPLLGGRTVRWSYRDLRTESRRIARSLLALEVQRGERVGILMGNRPDAVAALFGVALAGAVAVPLSTFAPPAELGAMLDLAEVTVVLTQDRLLARRFGDEVAALRRDLPRLRSVAVLGGSGWPDFIEGASGITSDAVDERLAETTPDDDALVIFSSGTTSVPKGMLHGHLAPTLQFWVQAQIFGRDETTRMWTALPMFWTAGLNSAMGSTLAAGGCWVMQETFDAGAALALMQRERVTEPYALPHQVAALEEHPEWLGTDLSSLRFVFGKSAFARHPTVRGDTSWMMPVGYGLSETCAFFVTHWWNTPRGLLKASVGRLLPGNQLRVVDPVTGRPLGVDAEGELAVKGPTLMKGYLGRAPEDCFDDHGFFHTGDSGYVDEEGFVHFTGRRTEMIKTGGANVSPAELEVQLRACPPVKLARIVGVHDARLDQVPVACITLKDGAAATAADIQAFLRERVASYKVPKHVLFFEDGEIPMTSSDTKVRDDGLRALVEQRLADEPMPTTSGER